LACLLLLAALGSAAANPQAAKPLEIYFVDVEGGQATLIVTPSGESLLVDTGWPGFNGRDADRIVAAAKLARVTRIDDLVITHYHADHVGGVTQLVERIPVVTFIDHGPNVETTEQAQQFSAAYARAVEKGKRRIVQPGDTIPLKGVEVKVLTANGEIIPTPAGAASNPYCSSTGRLDDDPSENARSLGILLTYGKFRFVDLGDLTWNKELNLMCPVNRVGTVDVYLTDHHGFAISGAKPLVWGLHPRVAVMNNGAKKGGEPAAWQIVRDSPGLEDFWQVHFSIEGGKDHNSAEAFIANPDENCEGKFLKLSAEPDGSFTITNSRNGFTKTYPAKQ
jgi:beta-lactamase superfamily II metal-dependent hydrolase